MEEKNNHLRAQFFAILRLRLLFHRAWLLAVSWFSTTDAPLPGHFSGTLKSFFLVTTTQSIGVGHRLRHALPQRLCVNSEFTLLYTGLNSTVALSWCRCIVVTLTRILRFVPCVLSWNSVLSLQIPQVHVSGLIIIKCVYFCFLPSFQGCRVAASPLFTRSCKIYVTALIYDTA